MNINFPLFRYQYNILLDSDLNYMGASAFTKRPRSGEDWLRGNDLADGRFSIRTFFRIAKDIVTHEFGGGRWAR